MNVPPTIVNMLNMVWNALANFIRVAIAYVQHLLSQA